ncbi:lanthionine synthetase LanC family protein, partial [Streptomyces sp. SID3343]|uniref:lanthionine synthetase LanC family protein n=1 Tax=Streptomyces sp. SID3343 TaxID=2690260 RepID=UPI0013C27757
ADGAVRALAAMEDGVPTTRLGAFDGVGSAVRTWLALYALSGRREELDRAIRHAERAAGLLAADTMLDVTAGAAGLIVPVLQLAQRTGDAAWFDVADAAARHLADRAVVDGVGGGAGVTAYWPTQVFPQGIGGFAHGAAGIGWALARLGHAVGEQRWSDLADAAFAFQETLYRPEVGNWLDRREAGQVLYLDSWCHGSTGVGLAAWDLYVRTGSAEQLDRAVRAAAGTWRTGFGWDYTLCHGDLGSWELVDAVLRGAPDAFRGAVGSGSGVGTGVEVTGAGLDAVVLSGVESYGPLSAGVAHSATASLMPGSSGALYQLLRMRRVGRVEVPPSLLLVDGS